MRVYLNWCRLDLWLTGEMSHHEVLDAVHSGIRSGHRSISSPCFLKRTSVVKNPTVEECVSDQTCCDISVVLCDHSNTERGYLQSDYAELLRKELPGVSITSSQSDQDPLQIV